MTERKLPPVNRPSLGERLPTWGVVAIVAVLLVVLAGGAVLARGTQAAAPTSAPTDVATAVASSPPQPFDDYADPETVTKAFYAAFERTFAHPQDLSDVMQYLLPGSFAVADTKADFDQNYVQKKKAFTASDVTISGCVVATGPMWTQVPAGGITPRPDLDVQHVTCNVSYSGQDTDLAGNAVGTHDPVWQNILTTEVQQFNGLWYVDEWDLKNA